MKITREESEEWNYPCFGKSDKGTVVWFTTEGQGTAITDSAARSYDWNTDCFTPIDNPFEEKVKKFKPVKIVLETKAEAVAMHNAMYECKEIEASDWKKLGNLLTN